MQYLQALAALLSIASSLKNLLTNPSKPVDIQALLAKVLKEVEDIVHEQFVWQDLLAAESTVDTLTQNLTNVYAGMLAGEGAYEYLNGLGVTDESNSAAWYANELHRLFPSGSDDAQDGSSDPETSGPQLQQALSVYLTIATLVLYVLQEILRQATFANQSDDVARRAVRKYAADYYAAAQSMLSTVVAMRLAAVGEATYEDHSKYPPPEKDPPPATIDKRYFFKDTWTGDDPVFDITYSWPAYGNPNLPETFDELGAVADVRAAYVATLRLGYDGGPLLEALNDIDAGNGAPVDSYAQFYGGTQDAFIHEPAAFGGWYVQALGTINAIGVLASEPLGVGTAPLALPVPVPVMTMAGPPAAATLGETTFVAFPSGGGAFAITSSNDGSSWSQAQAFGLDVGSPLAMAASADQLFVAFKRSSTGLLRLCTSSDGATWSVTDQFQVMDGVGGLVTMSFATDGAPAMTSFNGQPTLAFSSGGITQVLNLPVAPIPYVALGPLTGTPSMVAFNGRVYLAWRGTDGTLRVSSSPDGVTWTYVATIPEVTAAGAPAFAVYQGTLQMVFRDASGALGVLSTNDGILWSPDAGGSSVESGAPVIYPDVPLQGDPGATTLPNGNLLVALQGAAGLEVTTLSLPTASTSPTNSDHVVYRSTSGALYEACQQSGGAWCTIDVSDCTGTPAPAGGPHAFTSTIDGSEHLVFRDESGRVYDVSCGTANGVWVPQELPRDNLAAGDPRGYSWSPDGTENVVYRTESGALVQVSFKDGQWTPSTLPGAAPAGDPSVYTWSVDTSAHVIFRDQTGTIRELWRVPDDPAGWHEADWSSKVDAREAAGDPCGFTWSVGEIDSQNVAFRGDDGAIYVISNRRAKAGSSSQPNPPWKATNLMVAAGVAGLEAAGDPHAYTWSLDNSVHVVFRDAQGNLYEMWSTVMDTWTCAPISQLAGAPPAAGDPRGYASSASESIVYRGANGIVHRVSRSNGAWAPDDLAVEAAAPPAAGDPGGYRW